MEVLHIDLVDISHPILRELFLMKHSSYGGAVLVRALDSLQRPVLSIAEIGVYQGDCSRFLRHCFPTAQLYLIDPWETPLSYQYSDGPITKKEIHMNKAFQVVQHYFQEDPCAHIIRKTSKEAARIVPDSFDLVFIDGNHDYEYVKEDILLWLPKVRPGGILAGHDYDNTGETFPGVKKAVDECFGEKIYLGEDNVWLYPQEG